MNGMPSYSYAAARADFRNGSKSFAAAALLFDRATRRDATLIYAWCRHCDDVVDGQVLGFAGRAPADPMASLRALQRQTDLAFAGRAAPGTVFAGLQRVVTRCAIPQRLANEHLLGFRMDVEQRRYDTIEDTLDYCYHIAGVVGLMMGHVMGVRDATIMRRACDLGIAFQLTNIARDLVEDAQRGRVYVPATWLREAGIDADDLGAIQAASRRTRIAARLVDLSQDYYASGRSGIDALPWRSAWAIATALAVYRRIGAEILRRGEHAWSQRVRTSAGRKAALTLRASLAVIGSRRPVATLRPWRSVAPAPRPATLQEDRS